MKRLFTFRQIPDEHLEGLFEYDSSDDPEPRVVREEGVGVPDTDLILYVRSAFTSRCQNVCRHFVVGFLLNFKMTTCYAEGIFVIRLFVLPTVQVFDLQYRVCCLRKQIEFMAFTKNKQVQLLSMNNVIMHITIQQLHFIRSVYGCIWLQNSTISAYASYCHLDANNNKPLSGYINMCPRFLQASDLNEHKLYLVRCLSNVAYCTTSLIERISYF